MMSKICINQPDVKLSMLNYTMLKLMMPIVYA